MDKTENKPEYITSDSFYFPNPRSAEKFSNSMKSLSLMIQNIEGEKTTQNTDKMQKKEDDKASGKETEEKETEGKEEEHDYDSGSKTDDSDDELFFQMDDVK
jgi:hypothetical protein